MQELIGARLLKLQLALVTQTGHWLAMTCKADLTREHNIGHTPNLPLQCQLHACHSDLPIPQFQGRITKQRFKTLE